MPSLKLAYLAHDLSDGLLSHDLVTVGSELRQQHVLCIRKANDQDHIPDKFKTADFSANGCTVVPVFVMLVVDPVLVVISPAFWIAVLETEQGWEAEENHSMAIGSRTKYILDCVLPTMDFLDVIKIGERVKLLSVGDAAAEEESRTSPGPQDIEASSSHEKSSNKLKGAKEDRSRYEKRVTEQRPKASILDRSLNIGMCNQRSEIERSSVNNKHMVGKSGSSKVITLWPREALGPAVSMVVLTVGAGAFDMPIATGRDGNSLIVGEGAMAVLGASRGMEGLKNHPGDDEAPLARLLPSFCPSTRPMEPPESLHWVPIVAAGEVGEVPVDSIVGTGRGFAGLEVWRLTFVGFVEENLALTRTHQRVVSTPGVCDK
ncbi:uncharacterized protein EI90DRAFT_3022875 [Cantharellus anzutake]|uniref:uncharacterized protein n=1 Tax=Cantharellus anzutake TaxID=1750568 RepID=UPI00190484DD|nr:uncharacterized protein EI90DRAFT_3022875 [Cantharellus anzutake]KAF8312758.1 hypothetical protein EI90DRAFT_3022875 [Cantharellus anzutake]